MPPGATPPFILSFNASTVPILQLGLSGKDISEQQLFDIGQNFIRPQLVTVPGTTIPFAFGGKQRASDGGFEHRGAAGEGSAAPRTLSMRSETRT